MTNLYLHQTNSPALVPVAHATAQLIHECIVNNPADENQLIVIGTLLPTATDPQIRTVITLARRHGDRSDYEFARSYALPIEISRTGLARLTYHDGSPLRRLWLHLDPDLQTWAIGKSAKRASGLPPQPRFTSLDATLVYQVFHNLRTRACSPLMRKGRILRMNDRDSQ